MDRAMNVSDWYLFNGVNNVIGFQRIVAPRLMGVAPDEAAIAAAMPKAHTVFSELARLLGAQPYFTGESVTLADLMIAPQLDFLALTPEWTELSARHQNLVDWLARMNARPSFQATTWEKLMELAKAA
jgi:glutathione S-transferase